MKKHCIKFVLFVASAMILFIPFLNNVEVNAQETIDYNYPLSSRQYTILVPARNYKTPPKSIWHVDGLYSGYLYFEGSVFTGFEWKYRYSGYLRQGNYVPNLQIPETE